MSSGPATAAPTVRTRRVYYLAGFDTRSARFYHPLYQTEAALQQAIDGCRYEVGPLEPAGEHTTAWTVQADHAGQAVHTRYHFMAWNDIIRDHWPASTWRVAGTVPAFFWRFVRSGAWGGTWRIARPFFWMLSLPLWMTAASLLVGLLLGAATAALLGTLLPTGTSPGWALAGAVGVGLAVLALGLRYTEQLRVYWLMRAWTFMWRWINQSLPALDARCALFAHRIEADLATDPVDEVLIIGHSAGAMTALSIAARWLALRGPDRPPPKAVKLVTMGNVHPFFGLVPEGGWYRDEMSRIAAAGMTWVDYTAPADPLCYALVDALAACGLRTPANADYRAKSARFDRMFEAARYAELRRDFFRIHFQYLMATERPVDNDYFHLTAGPRALSLAAMGV